VLFTATVMLILTLKSSFVQALTISAIARLVTYAVTCLALPVFRRRADFPPASFKLPGGTVIALLSLALAVWLVSNSTGAEARAAGIAAAVGLVIFLLYRYTGGRNRVANDKPGQ
jgi:basic amino acid/polyamine antiporter, APA family